MATETNNRAYSMQSSIAYADKVGTYQSYMKKNTKFYLIIAIGTEAFCHL